MQAHVPLPVLLLLTLLTIAITVSGSSVPLREVLNAHESRWQRGDRASPERLLELRVALTPAKSDAEISEAVAAVADPTSPLYGQHLALPEQLRVHFAPLESHSQRMSQVFQVDQVLTAEPMDAIGDFWRVTLPVRAAEDLFETQLYQYAHRQRPGLSVVRPERHYRIPDALGDVVAYVDGLESFPTEMQARFLQHGVLGRTGHTGERDPLAVRQQPFTNWTTSLGAGQKLEVAPEGATPAVIREQYDIPSQLHIDRQAGELQQKVTQGDAVARNKLVLGTFLQEFYSEKDLREFLDKYDGRDDAAAKLPTSRGPCQVKDNRAHRATGEASLDVQVATSLAGHHDGQGDTTSIEMLCYAQLRDPTRPYAADNQEPFLTFLQDVNAMRPPPAVVSISYTDDECSVPPAYAEAVNRELMKTALRGISVLVSAGDAGVQGSHLVEEFCGIPHCSAFLGMFPASSPFVTAVGATTIATGSPRDVRGKWHEIVTATSQANALITSGGGFSDVFDMPSYQTSVVEPYLAFANASGISPFFRTSGRAYPDLAAVGHAFPVVINGQVSSMDGTSVSAPVLASMVALLNRALPKLPPLGFLNPLLYRLQAGCPHVFTDITQGDISCGSKEMKCCTRGHAATVGWDAASGLGTLRFKALQRDLPDCMERIKAQAREVLEGGLASQNLMAEDLATTHLKAETPVVQVDGGLKWTTTQQHAMKLVGGVVMVAAVGLVAVLVSLRGRLFLDPHQRRGYSCERYGVWSARESAREYLLAAERASK